MQHAPLEVNRYMREFLARAKQPQSPAVKMTAFVV
jgi:hypothetical protein